MRVLWLCIFVTFLPSTLGAKEKIKNFPVNSTAKEQKSSNNTNKVTENENHFYGKSPLYGCRDPSCNMLEETKKQYFGQVTLNKSNDACPLVHTQICNDNIEGLGCVCYFFPFDETGEQIVLKNGQYLTGIATDDGVEPNFSLFCDKIYNLRWPIFEIKFEFPLPARILFRAEELLGQLINEFAFISPSRIVTLRRGCDFEANYYFIQFIILKHERPCTKHQNYSSLDHVYENPIADKDLALIPLEFLRKNYALMKQRKMRIDDIKKRYFIYPIQAKYFPAFWNSIETPTERPLSALAQNCTDTETFYRPSCWSGVYSMKMMTLGSILLLLCGICAYNTKLNRLEKRRKRST